VLPVIDYGTFADRLADRTDRWSLLIEFQREWGYLGESNRGFAISTAEEAGDEDDAEYCPVVPEAVTQWYALPQNSFMKAARMYWTHPHVPVTRWPSTDELEQAGAPDADPALVPERRGVFMAEYEYCWTWSYLEHEAAGNADPPVYIADTELSTHDLRRLLTGENDLGEYMTARSVSEWALAFAVTSIPFAIRATVATGEMDAALVDRDLVDRHAAYAAPEISEEQRELITASFPTLGLLPWHEFGCYDLLGGPDVIISLRRAVPDYEYAESDNEFEIAGRTRQALEDALKLIGLSIAA
jgi:hypothetical protein